MRAELRGISTGQAVSSSQVRLMVCVISFALVAGACTFGRGPESHRRSLPPSTTSIEANVLGCSFEQGSATIRVSFDTTLKPSTGEATFKTVGAGLQAVTPFGLKDLGLDAMTPPSEAWTAFTVPIAIDGNDLDVIEFNSLFLSVQADEHAKARSPSDLIGREFQVPGGLTARVITVRRRQGTLGIALLIPSADIEPGIALYGATGTLALDGRVFQSSEFASPLYSDAGIVVSLLFGGMTGHGRTVLTISGWSIAVERGPRISLSDCS